MSATAKSCRAIELRTESFWLSSRRARCVRQITGVTSPLPCTRNLVRHFSPDAAKQVGQKTLISSPIRRLSLPTATCADLKSPSVLGILQSNLDRQQDS